ncbi:hypothetical protein J3R82DRAFT_122 [Butyriboletus roseoflavus]|nr:hypothetical protein J3R82DRAFT_122 [Butyriboletus roseoflavus]
MIISLNVKHSSIKIALADINVAPAVYDIPIIDIKWVFRYGDEVKVLAGIHYGSAEMVLSSSEDIIILLVKQDLNVISNLSSSEIIYTKSLPQRYLFHLHS